MSKKVTMQQIANYLGISKYVVSKALSGKEGVNERTRSKVLGAASQLGYFAQKNSKVSHIKLNDLHYPEKQQGERNVLVLMPNVRYQNTESSYWGGIVDGITSGLETLGFGVIVVTETNTRMLSAVLVPNSFLGVISVGLVSSALLLEVQKLNVPVVMIDYEDALIPCDTLFNNNFDSSIKLANYLVGLDHRRIQFVGDINYSRSFYDRWLGLRSVLEENNLSVQLDPDLYMLDVFKIEELFEKWLRKERPLEEVPSAIVCANDNIAARVISVLDENGINVPSEISVTGFDNKSFTYKQTPTITTVNVAKKDLGKRAVEMLIRRLREKEAPFEKVMLAGMLMLRESTDKVNKLGGK